jgi:ATP-dependent RNA helicase RhlE
VVFADLNLSTPLLNALNDLSLDTPTPIQEKTFSIIMSGKDMVGIAQTGTGKTYAYLLPLLRLLKFSDQRHPRILILVPTRELVLQVVESVEKLTTYMNLRCIGVYGGTNINTQKQTVYDGCDILVATPGRLIDLNLTGVLRLKSIQKLIIDEVDEMLDLGFQPQLMSLMESLPERRQNIMFSATLTSEVEELINNFCINPTKVEIAPHGTPLEKIAQTAYFVPNFNTKINLLEILLTNSEMEKVLVFVSTKKEADRLQHRLENRFHDELGIIHSNKSQNQRINALKQFERGTYRILIATDLVARGLDITDITHVINVDVPTESANYIHRIGRTGRAEKEGAAITLVAEYEENRLKDIEKLMGKKIEIGMLPENLTISFTLTRDEKPTIIQKDYLKSVSVPKTGKEGGGAFHEKKAKNKKVNLGGPGKRNPKQPGRPNGKIKTTKPDRVRF